MSYTETPTSAHAGLGQVSLHHVQLHTSNTSAITDPKLAPGICQSAVGPQSTSKLWRMDMVDSRDCFATLKYVWPPGCPWLSSMISWRPCRDSAFGRILNDGIPWLPVTCERRTTGVSLRQGQAKLSRGTSCNRSLADAVVRSASAA